MSRQIKLIWDFKGEVATNTALHHLIHLKEYIASEKLAIAITGTEVLNDFHAIAFLVVNDAQMIAIRDVLKPHRGELYQP
ncbi:hypothetical protein [Flavobacterium sp. JP2137]|uniref:hypothetical protein n=1 Tax=Flavobacterium sp. JP2137 TaxID=3414510 RepID=UPI003D2FF9DB